MMTTTKCMYYYNHGEGEKGSDDNDDDNENDVGLNIPCIGTTCIVLLN